MNACWYSAPFPTQSPRFQPGNGATQWTGPPTSINEIKLSPNGRTSTEACLSGNSMFCQVDNQQEPSDPAMI